MKGMELPINMIVVVLIAVLVLVTVSTFLAGQLGGGTGSINLEGVFSAECNKLRTFHNCADTNFVVTGYTAPGKTAGTPTYFSELCTLKGYSPAECLIACGCKTTT